MSKEDCIPYFILGWHQETDVRSRIERHVHITLEYTRQSINRDIDEETQPIWKIKVQ